MDDMKVFGINVHKDKKFKSYIFDNRNNSIKDLLAQIEDLNKNKNDLNFANRLMFEMYNSNKIEGNTLSRQETKLVLENKVLPENCNYKDFLECINLNNAIEDFRKIKYIDSKTIKDIHKTLTRNIVEPSNCGKFRTEPVYISNCLHVPPKADMIESLMENSIIKFNNSNRTLIDIFVFKLELVTIHPFTDGNGRTSRVIMNGMLEDLGYPRVIFKDVDKKFYYKALEDAQVKYMINNWIRYCLLLLKYNLEYLNSITILE